MISFRERLMVLDYIKKARSREREPSLESDENYCLFQSERYYDEAYLMSPRTWNSLTKKHCRQISGKENDMSASVLEEPRAGADDYIPSYVPIELLRKKIEHLVAYGEHLSCLDKVKHSTE
jgi:hypothetical protein